MIAAYPEVVKYTVKFNMPKKFMLKVIIPKFFVRYTVNFLNIRTPKIFVVIILKFEPCGSTIE